MRYGPVIFLLSAAAPPPLLAAALAIADRLKIPVPGDILAFSAAGFLAMYGLPLSLILVVCAAVLAAVIYISGRNDAM